MATDSLDIIIESEEGYVVASIPSRLLLDSPHTVVSCLREAGIERERALLGLTDEKPTLTYRVDTRTGLVFNVAIS
jgi:hypothetical protein